MLGVCKWFNQKKGYGFIGREDGQGDVFFHISNILTGINPQNLKQDQKVIFDLGTSKDGNKLQAINIGIVE